jgi:hypothetical protein
VRQKTRAEQNNPGHRPSNPLIDLPNPIVAYLNVVGIKPRNQSPPLEIGTQEQFDLSGDIRGVFTAITDEHEPVIDPRLPQPVHAQLLTSLQATLVTIGDP